MQSEGNVMNLVLQVPASRWFEVTRICVVRRKSAGPACRSPLVSKPRAGKAVGNPEVEYWKHWPAVVSKDESKLRRKCVRICSDGK